MPRLRRVLVLSVLLSAGVLAAHAQSPDPLNPVDENLTVPSDWQVHFDDADAAPLLAAQADSGAVRFVHMTPGWHLTAGPAALYVAPTAVVGAQYRAETVIHLFPPGEANAGFGLFVGDAAAPNGLAFVIRRSGEYALHHHTAEGVTPVIGWTAHAAIRPYPPDGKGVVTNRLALVARGEDVLLYVNDQFLESVPRAGLPTTGVAGLRLDEGPLNLHIEDFLVRTQR